MKIKILLVVASIAVICGCAVAPGSRAVVVRAEQSISVANATLDAAVHVDQANRSFFQTNAPGFHAFCEWLREPVIIAPLTNTQPRGLAIVRSADAIKNTFKASNNTNDYAALITALALVEQTTSEAQIYLTQIHTH